MPWAVGEDALEYYNILASFWPKDPRVYQMRAEVKAQLGDMLGTAQDNTRARELFEGLR